MGDKNKELEEGQKTVTKSYSAAFEKGGDDSQRKVRAIISSEAIDRDMDSMSLTGLNVSHFLKNPVVLWNHNHNIPIAKATSISIEEGKMIADVVFPEEGISPKSDEVYGLIKAGIINSTSIGFIMQDLEFKEVGDDYHWKITESELMEFSFVSVPSNREAMILERSVKSFAKSKGIVMPDQFEEDNNEETNEEKNKEEIPVTNNAASKRARKIALLFLEEENE